MSLLEIGEHRYIKAINNNNNNNNIHIKNVLALKKNAPLLPCRACVNVTGCETFFQPVLKPT